MGSTLASVRFTANRVERSAASCLSFPLIRWALGTSVESQGGSIPEYGVAPEKAFDYTLQWG